MIIIDPNPGQRRRQWNSFETTFGGTHACTRNSRACIHLVTSEKHLFTSQPSSGYYFLIREVDPCVDLGTNESFKPILTLLDLQMDLPIAV